jgi:hypothetical protein
MDLAPHDKVVQIENDYDKESTTATSATSTRLVPRQANWWRALTGAP